MNEADVTWRDMAPGTYQNVELWVSELLKAGWLPWHTRLNTRADSNYSQTWRAPDGRLFRGPFGAWKRMKAEATA